MLFFLFRNWSAMAKEFGLDKTLPDRRRRFPPRVSGWFLARSWILAGANREGLFLALMPLISFGRPPLFIPWTRITSIRKKEGFFSDRAILAFGTSRPAHLPIPWRCLDQARSQIDPDLWDAIYQE